MSTEPTEEKAGSSVAAGATDAAGAPDVPESATSVQEESADTPGRTLLLVHGRGPKPSQAQLLMQWRKCLDRSLERDYPNATNLNSVRVQLAYYADLLDDYLPENYNAATHAADREAALKTLLKLKNTKQFRRVHYDALPGKTSRREFLADISAPLSSVFGFSEARIKRVLPELLEYWKNPDLAVALRDRLQPLLLAAFERGDEIMVISHCLGSVIAYDTFWELSRSRELRDRGNRVSTWVTLGSPLADDYVRHHLLGGKAHPGSGKEVSYPDLVNHWLNVAAEDDHVCHDETMANDFKAMLEQKLISRIHDFQIYNLTERFGRSNPHGSFGYLVHPRMGRILNDWLSPSIDT